MLVVNYTYYLCDFKLWCFLYVSSNNASACVDQVIKCAIIAWSQPHKGNEYDLLTLLLLSNLTILVSRNEFKEREQNGYQQQSNESFKR